MQKKKTEKKNEYGRGFPVRLPVIIGNSPEACFVFREQPLVPCPSVAAQQ